MIPTKIITREEAIKKGLTNDSRENVVAVGVVASKKQGSDIPETIEEKSIIRANGTKELIFISEKRKKQFKKQELKKYLKQFKKVEGQEIESFLKTIN